LASNDRLYFDGKVGLQQRVLPGYRIPFFDQLSSACAGFELFAGSPKTGEAILAGEGPEHARWVRANNRHLLGGPLYLLRQPGLLDWLDRWRPELLILEANSRYVDNWRALAWARRNGVRVVGWGLGAPALSRSLAPTAWLWRNFLARFDGLIAYSSRGAAEYRRTGLAEERIFVATNAVVNAPSEPVHRQAPLGRPLHLLFVGRLQPRKGVGRLLRACADLGPDQVVLRVVGSGPDLARLQHLAKAEFPAAEFPGSQRGEALLASYRWADIFVLPGTGGLAVQQAMAHGLPVIVGQGDGTQADLVREENGWLVLEDTESALRRAIEQALASRADLPAMGMESTAIVAQEVNVEAMVRTFVSAMRTVTEAAVR
jgi:glycosyltransferase involved in cell wall biosynthesis